MPSDGGKVTRRHCSTVSRRGSPSPTTSRVRSGPTNSTTPMPLNGYRQIGAELLAQLATVDAFCGAVGTGHAVGVSRALKEGAAARGSWRSSPTALDAHDRPRRTASCRRYRAGLRASAPDGD